MKKLLVIAILLCLSVAAFADVSGTVTNKTVFDADAETLIDTAGVKLTVGPVVFTNTFYLTGILAEPDIDWAGAIDYALNSAISFGVATSHGVDSEDNVPLTLKTSWKIADFLTIKGQYVNDNLNVEEPEIGTFTVEASFSF